MGGRVAAVALLVAVALTGCGTSPSTQPDTSDRADSLWSARSPYVGDGSKVVALVSQAGFGPAGSYTVELQTDRAPYGVTVRLHHLDKPFRSTDFSAPATVLLGLVTNLDRVTVAAGGQTYALTAAGATTSLGYDVKSLGQHRDKLVAYVRGQQD
ncbi:MAG: DUF4825 domain-containing protein [Oryzihumus sp.]